MFDSVFLYFSYICLIFSLILFLVYLSSSSEESLGPSEWFELEISLIIESYLVLAVLSALVIGIAFAGAVYLGKKFDWEVSFTLDSKVSLLSYALFSLLW